VDISPFTPYLTSFLPEIFLRLTHRLCLINSLVHTLQDLVVTYLVGALLAEMINTPTIFELSIPKHLVIFLALMSLVLIVVSLINLGSATCLGLPKKSTRFRTNGFYKISRNPMFLGFSLLSLSAIL
jgi:protein-S-isoprenylcysteine O-methyltransferase Ste14